MSEKSFSNDSIFKQVGDYKIFLVAFSTDFIPADIASKNQIVRATDRGLVNISIMKEFAEGYRRQLTDRFPISYNKHKFSNSFPSEKENLFITLHHLNLITKIT